MHQTSNYKKHQRKKIRNAEKKWHNRKAEGLCPYCQELTYNEYLCDVCAPKYDVCVTDYVTQYGDITKTNVWLYKRLD